MALTVREDIVGGRHREDAEGGISSDRVFLVLGLTGPGFARFEQARLAPKVPRRGDRHPKYPQARARVFSIEPVEDGGQARVTVTYETPTADAGGGEGEVNGPASSEWVVELTSESTVYDRSGNLMETQYWSGGTYVKQVHRVDVERAMYSVRLTRLLPYDARWLNLTFTNRINSRPWSGFPAYAVRCRGFQSSQEAPGRHRVTGTFSASPAGDGTWSVTLVAIDSDGLVPTDIVKGNGVSLRDVYEPVDFNATGFVVP